MNHGAYHQHIMTRFSGFLVLFKCAYKYHEIEIILSVWDAHLCSTFILYSTWATVNEKKWN